LRLPFIKRNYELRISKCKAALKTGMNDEPRDSKAIAMLTTRLRCLEDNFVRPDTAHYLISTNNIISKDLVMAVFEIWCRLAISH